MPTSRGKPSAYAADGTGASSGATEGRGFSSASGAQLCAQRRVWHHPSTAEGQVRTPWSQMPTSFPLSEGTAPGLHTLLTPKQHKGNKKTGSPHGLPQRLHSKGGTRAAAAGARALVPGACPALPHACPAPAAHASQSGLSPRQPGVWSWERAPSRGHPPSVHGLAHCAERHTVCCLPASSRRDPAHRRDCKAAGEGTETGMRRSAGRRPRCGGFP